jgi:hypothetical protein
MALTSAELSNISSAALDYYINRGNVMSQSIQDKPLFAAMDKASKTFPGGKSGVDLAVKGVYTTTVAGYNAADTVTYTNPANIKRANYTWKEHHAGLAVTMTELKNDGISITDTAIPGDSVKKLSGRDKQVLVNLLDDKLEDLAEGYTRGMNNFLYGDGTADAKAIAGIRSIIKDAPGSAGTIGGIDHVANTWWRNRASLAIATTATGNELIAFLHSEIRQLRKFGGKPSLAVCGSLFLDRLATELRSHGNYSQTGFNGKQDISMGEISYQGINFKYDPALDDLTVSGKNPDKRCYIIDPSKMYLMYMEGEKMKKHSPARPHTSYVFYKAITTTAVLCASQVNCHGVYEIA